jgi:hypothetical protein
MMLAYLAGRAIDRKLRLYACACVRKVWPHLVTEDQGRQLVELHERYADGLVSREEVVAAAQPAWKAVGLGFDCSVEHRGKEDSPEKRAVVVASLAQCSAAGAARYFTDCWRRDNDQERNKLCQFFREIFGNPFHPTALDPSWLTWNGGTVTRFAQGIYDERAFDHLPILADALEEASCDSADILSHCRGAEPHVRGCWVVDLLLGKE